MGRFRREEDEADKWLRKHDPYYTDRSGHKSKKISNPYDTARMERSKAEAEIPFSNLTKSQRVQMKDYVGSFNERGEFEM